MEDGIANKITSSGSLPEKTLKEIVKFLDKNKAENVVTIDLRDKSSIADYMLIASGSSQRQVKSLADKTEKFLRENGIKDIHVEGTGSCDWVLVDANGIIIHIFRQEMRDFYNLEALWGSDFEGSQKISAK